MTNPIRAAIIALVLSLGAANAWSATYHAPAHNAYQNNWMSSR